MPVVLLVSVYRKACWQQACWKFTRLRASAILLFYFKSLYKIVAKEETTMRQVWRAELDASPPERVLVINCSVLEWSSRISSLIWLQSDDRDIGVVQAPCWRRGVQCSASHLSKCEKELDVGVLPCLSWSMCFSVRGEQRQPSPFSLILFIQSFDFLASSPIMSLDSL